MTMEDAHMVSTSIPVEGHTRPLSNGHAIFGVMDGHGGDFTSGFASENFIRIFSGSVSLMKYAAMSNAQQCDVPGVQLLRAALSETFHSLDVEIRAMQNKRNDTVMMMTERMEREAGGAPINRVRFERSGSTCVVVMVTPSHIICANAGDSRAVLRRNGKVLPLSFDHKPNNIPELQRINEAGGFVKCKRVDGDLAVSRGLGDFSYKSNEKRLVEHQKVVPEPEFVVYPRDLKRDEFLVLACDGVWDVATNEECSNFVQELLLEGERDLGLICEEAIDSCLDKKSRDNMTIAMITFDAASLASSMNGRNAVWQRRTARQAKNLEKSAKLVATKAAAGAAAALGMTPAPTPTAVAP